MEALMREEGMPLFSLESKHAIREFDLLGISLPYEQLFTNALNLIDLAGMPVRSARSRRILPADHCRGACLLQSGTDGPFYRCICHW